MPNTLDIERKNEIKKDIKKGIKKEDIKKKINVDKDNIENNNKKNKKEIKKKKRKKIFIGILAFFIFSIFIISSVIIFNIFNIGDIYSKSILSKVPIIKNIPIQKKDSKNNKMKISRSELISKIDKLELEIKKYEKELEDINELNSIYAEEILRLKEIEKLQKEFKDDKEKFDKMIAEENKLKFMDFYKSISPENAENLYKEILKTNNFNKEFKNFINTFEDMNKNKAAEILENMITSDINLVSSILNNISIEKRSAIISSMDCNNASIVIRAIAPEENKRK